MKRTITSLAAMATAGAKGNGVPLFGSYHELGLPLTPAPRIGPLLNDPDPHVMNEIRSAVDQELARLAARSAGEVATVDAWPGRTYSVKKPIFWSFPEVT